MPGDAFNHEQKYRIIIYHGHLHKIPIDDNKKEDQELEANNSEESIY